MQESGDPISVDIIGYDFMKVANSCVIGPDTGNASINISWPSTDDTHYYYSLFISFFAVRILVLFQNAK